MSLKKSTTMASKSGGLDAGAKDAAFEKAIKSAGNGAFLDKDFMPEPARLIPDWNDQSEEVQSLVPAFKTYQWLKVKDIKSLNDDEGEVKIFFGEIEPTDIKQGALGNCYFLSAISVLTEHPQRVRNMFASTEINP